MKQALFLLVVLSFLLIFAQIPAVEGKKKKDDAITLEYESESDLADKVQELGKKQQALHEEDELTFKERRLLENEESSLRRKLFEAGAEFGEHSRERVTALHLLGRNVYKRGIYSEVLEVSKEIVTIHEVLDGPESVATAHALSNVGSVAYRLKDTAYCELVMNRALYIFLAEYDQGSKEVMVHRGRMLTFHVPFADTGAGLSHEDFLYEL